MEVSLTKGSNKGWGKGFLFFTCPMSTKNGTPCCKIQERQKVQISFWKTQCILNVLNSENAGAVSELAGCRIPRMPDQNVWSHMKSGHFFLWLKFLREFPMVYHHLPHILVAVGWTDPCWDQQTLFSWLPVLRIGVSPISHLQFWIGHDLPIFIGWTRIPGPRHAFHNFKRENTVHSVHVC